MRIIVRFESSLRDISGLSEDSIDLQEGAAVQSLLNKLVDRYGNRIIGADQEYNWRHAASHVIVVRNGEVVSEENYGDVGLVDGDIVSLVPPIAGGSTL